jgi:hypothetical protein
LEAQLQPGERLLLTTAGHCDCGTALGASSARRPSWSAAAGRTSGRRQACAARAGGNPGFSVGATNNRM